MPRPQKDGIDYFPLDVNFFSDPKIKILKARYGVDGVMIFIYLLCEIYRAGYYIRFDEDRLFIMSDDLNMSSDKVMQVLTFLLDRSMLDSMLFQSDAVLTSAGIQRRFQLAVKERAKKNPVEVKGFWLLEETETEPFIKVNQFLNKSQKNDNNSGKNSSNSREESPKESKVKKSKEKESKNISSEPGTGPRPAVFQLPMITGEMHKVFSEDVEKYKNLYPAVDVEQEFRKMLGWLDANPSHRKTPRGMNRFINGWLCRAQDSARTAPGTKQKKNSFHNFDQRGTDYDAMEIDLVKDWLGEGEPNG